MRRSLLAACLVGAVCAAPAAQGTFPLQRKMPDPNAMPALTMGRRYVRAQEAPGQEPTGVPKAAAGSRGFFLLRIGDQSRWAAYVPGERPQLLVDTDGDGDLSDETPLPDKASGNTADFGTVSVTLKDGATSTVRLQGMGQKAGAPPRYLLLAPGDCRMGTVTLAGQSYAVALVDGNMNGRYNDAFDGTLNYRNLDGLGIDLNGDGTFAPPHGVEGPFEVTPLGTRVRVGEVFYHVTPAADGSSVTLEAVEPGVGTLDLGAPGATLLAYSDYGISPATAGPDGTVRLSAGRYAVLRLTLSKADPSDVVWQLTMTQPSASLESLEIRKGHTHRIPVGPPLVAEVDVQQSERLARLNLMLRGAAGERYVPGVRKGQRRTPPPSFEILGDDDKTLHTGKFEYG